MLVVNNYFSAGSNANAKQMRSSMGGMYAGTRRQKHSNLHTHGSRRSSFRHAANRYSHWAQQSRPYSAVGSNVLRSHYSTFSMEKFNMLMQSSEAPEPIRTIHEFTKLRPIAKLSPLHVGDFERLRSDCPQLASYTEEELLKTQIISAASTIRLVDSYPNDAEVGIELELHYNGSFDRYQDFECCVRFFVDEQLVRLPQKNSNDAQTGRRYDTTEIRDHILMDRTKRQLGNVHFGSDYWARVLQSSMTKLKSTNADLRMAMEREGTAAIEYENRAKNARSELEKGFKSLSALQEISALSRSSGKREILLLICWKFEQCTDENKSGETTWRNVTINRNTTPHAPAAVPGALPYALHSVKEESFSQPTWNTDAMDLVATTEGAAASLQQAFDPSQAYALPDFSTISIQNLPTALVEEQLASQVYTDNDFDFTGGHIQLNLGPSLADPSINLIEAFQHEDSAMDHSGALYDQSAQDWHELSYPDPYFTQSQTVEYSTIRTYDDHQDSPFSEAGAQQHPDSAIEMSGHGKHFAGPIQHLLTASTQVDGSEAIVMSEEPMHEHEYLEHTGDADLEPQQYSGMQNEHQEIHGVHVYEGASLPANCGHEHAIPSIEIPTTHSIAM